MQHGLVAKLTYPGNLMDSFCAAQVPLQQTAYASAATHIHPVVVMNTKTLITQNVHSVLETIGKKNQKQNLSQSHYSSSFRVYHTQ